MQMLQTMLYALLAGSVLVGSTLSVQAQSSVDEDLLLQINAIGSSMSANVASIQQIGNVNEAILNQVENGNSAQVAQFGKANVIMVQQGGSMYSMAILQLGTANSYYGDVEGFDANLDIFQLGNNNQIEQRSKLTDANLIIIQMGDNHELIQTRDIENTQGMRIIQRGNGAKAFIR